MLLDVARQRAEDVKRRSFAFAQRVRPVGIIHHVEWLAEFDEFIDKQLGALEVNVVVA